jgi:ribose transport system permease protein
MGKSQSEQSKLATTFWNVAYRIAPLRGILALGVVILIGAIFSPRDLAGWPIFLKGGTQADVLFECAEYGILATGMTLVILSGGIDLSVGSVLGFSAMVFSLLIIGYGWSPVPAIIVTVIVGAATGAVSGGLISKFRLQPFIATLGVMVAARGAAMLISNNIKIQPGVGWYALKSSPPFYDWFTGGIFGLSIRPITLLFLITILIALVIVKFSRFGRELYAIGGNEEAARLSGVKVGWVKIAAYSLCGLTAALAGICNASRQGLGDPQAGFTFELDAIAAVVIGGTSLMGGQGGMFFTLVGTLIIAYILKILSLNNVDEPKKLLAKALVIIVAVLIQQAAVYIQQKRKA